MKEFFQNEHFKVALIEGGEYLKKAQTLRHKVFLGQDGVDVDPFDKFCKHLVAIDKKDDAVVGTYRLLLASEAEKGKGFFSESKFDISNIKKHCRGEKLEMGRACVHESFRKHRIINLLWKAILMYTDQCHVQYILGCSGFKNPSPEKVGMLFRYFKNNCYAPEQLRVYPLADKVYQYNGSSRNVSDAVIERSLPRLVYGYFKMGAVVCGEPALNETFNTALFFMILETRNINNTYKDRFI